MKELYRPLLNWRTHVLAILAIVALLFIMCECDNLFNFLIIKIVGFGIAYVTYRLGKYWDSKGKIDELMELANEED